jgi:predicted small lipoprotein YifL
MMRALVKSLVLLATVLALAGCGLAETGATAAAGAESAAQQAKQAQETEAKVQQQINAAYQEDAARRKAAEAQAQ